jgi:kumamolisin
VSASIRELSGSERAPMAGAQRLGASDPEEVIRVSVIVRRSARSPPPPPPRFEPPVPGPRPRSLSRAEFAARHAADPDDLAAVRRFAAARGLRVVAEHPVRRTVELEGPARALSSAFGVTLERYDFPGGRYRGRTGSIRLPEELDGRVVAVLGLDDRPQARAHFRVRSAAAAGGVSYTPPQVAAAYSFPSGVDGTGECIALLELGGGYAPGDLAAYFQSLAIPAPTVEAVSVDGASNAPTGDPSGPDGEVELDVEVAGALAPGATIAVYFAPNTDRGYVDALSSAVHDTTRHPSIVSVSWGGPEPSWTAQARAAIDAVLQDAATLGVTVLAAAGDNGADDAGAGSGLSVDYPASSPLVLGCGGTRLELSGGAIAEEVVWNDLAANEGATGGGVSVDYPTPSYQQGFSVPLAPNGAAGRGVPDVAGDADPETGYRVLVDGQTTVIGGTSAVAPLWAALLARVNQLLGAPVGFVNPHLYADAATGAFHAITSGGNGGYNAGPGWNPCTGLGSPEGTALAGDLRGT